MVLVLILWLLFVSISVGRFYHYEESESGWHTGLRQSQNVTMHVSGFSMGDGSFNRYGEIGLDELTIKDRTSAANGSIFLKEKVDIKADDSNDVTFAANKPPGVNDWYVTVNESWPARIDSYRSLDFKGRQINDQESFGDNFEHAGSSLLYAESLRKDTAVTLILKDAEFKAIINDTNNNSNLSNKSLSNFTVIVSDKFLPNLTLIMDQRLSFTGQATLKYKHSQDRVPVLEGEDNFWGTFTTERNINSTSVHYNFTDIDPDMMSCCLDPKDLREYNLMTSPEVRKWLDSR
jgi:hypothetical protein